MDQRVYSTISCLIFLTGSSLDSYAQPYPTKPLRVVTHPPGGSSDPVARLIAQGLATALGQQVIVDNRSGIIAPETVARAQPDGYTLLLFGTPFWITPLMEEGVSYDPVRDFTPITAASSSPSILVVHPSLQAHSVKELVALAKAKPGSLNYASAVSGSANHLAAELFKSMTGVNIVRINYKGAGPALNDVIAGQVQMMFPNATTALPHVKSGRLRALAVTTDRPTQLAPELPTIAASGVPGYESASILGIYAPAKTPAIIVSRLNKDIVDFLNMTKIRERLLAGGSEVIGSTSQQLGAMVKSEMARMGRIIKEAGIKAD